MVRAAMMSRPTWAHRRSSPGDRAPGCARWKLSASCRWKACRSGGREIRSCPGAKIASMRWRRVASSRPCRRPKYSTISCGEPSVERRGGGKKAHSGADHLRILGYIKAGDDGGAFSGVENGGQHAQQWWFFPRRWRPAGRRFLPAGKQNSRRPRRTRCRASCRGSA